MRETNLKFFYQEKRYTVVAYHDDHHVESYGVQRESISDEKEPPFRSIPDGYSRPIYYPEHATWELDALPLFLDEYEAELLPSHVYTGQDGESVEEQPASPAAVDWIVFHQRVPSGTDVHTGEFLIEENYGYEWWGVYKHESPFNQISDSQDVAILQEDRHRDGSVEWWYYPPAYFEYWLKGQWLTFEEVMSPDFCDE